MNELRNDGDPWSPVDQSATSLDAPTPEPIVRGGNVTAHIDLGGKDEKPSEEEQETTEEEAAADSSTVDEKTAAEVEDAEAALAEKLAALDAAKSGKKKR